MNRTSGIVLVLAGALITRSSDCFGPKPPSTPDASAASTTDATTGSVPPPGVSGGVVLSGNIDASPTGDDVRNALRIDRPFYFQNDTYAGDVSQLLAKIVAMLPANGKSCTDEQSWRSPMFIDRLPATFTDAQKPEQRKSIVLTKNIAASVDFFGYLSSQLTNDQVFSLFATDITRRVKDTEKSYTDGKDKWKVDNKKYLDDENVCFLGIVEGAVQKTITRKRFTKVEGAAGGGAFGLKANGSYFSSDEEFDSDYWFGIDVTWWKWPTKPKADPKAEKKGSDLSDKEKKILDANDKFLDAPKTFTDKLKGKTKPDLQELFK